MKLLRPRYLIAYASAAAVLLLAFVDSGRTAPGPLTAVHQREPDLDGRRDCSECHGGWRRNMSQACLDCHEAIEQDVAAATGLHGVLGEEQALACSRCHSEHHGNGFAIVNRQSFALAGVADPQAFDHARIGFEMAGAHVELECRECHENADIAVLPRGEPRFIGLEQDCATCHEDVHDGQFELACAACHGQEEWTGLHSQGHEEHLPLVGGHAGLDCRACHAESDPHALEVLGGRGEKPGARDCAACHESPHTQPFELAAARSYALPAGGACVECHAAEHTSFRDERLELTDDAHAASGFALDAPHDEVVCADCHAHELEGFEARYPGRSADACGACHEDPHGGQFDAGPFAAEGCVACHGREHFEPHEFSLALHDLAALPLEGAHSEIECAECHSDPPQGSPREFRGTPSECVACHEDAHHGYFDAHAAELGLVQHGTCAACHLATRFDELPPEGFDHGHWTVFAVAGAHAQARCEVCHEPRDAPDERGRSFGLVAEQVGTFTGCRTCHSDPHEGQFDRPGLPAQVDGRQDCERCHDDVSFRALPHGFDHGAWTHFALEGRHALAECSACHAPVRASPTSERTWGRAQGTDCADCHADVHRGQFAVEGRTDCGRCHTTSPDFKEIVFDHERGARFALGEAHADVACAACHPTEVSKSGVSSVRYRPLPLECSGCHGVHDEPLLRRRRGTP